MREVMKVKENRSNFERIGENPQEYKRIREKTKETGQIQLRSERIQKGKRKQYEGIRENAT